jgi:hypothetical protein
MPDPTESTKKSGEITPEMVRQVADEVYKMLRRELLIERERERRLRRRPFSGHGGR